MSCSQLVVKPQDMRQNETNHFVFNTKGSKTQTLPFTNREELQIIIHGLQRSSVWLKETCTGQGA